MIYMKHPELGNKHVAPSEQVEREAAGWVKWPRTKEQKSGVTTEADDPDEVVNRLIPTTARAKPGPKPKAK